MKVYDLRKMTDPVCSFSADCEDLEKMSVSCAVYNWNGSEVCEISLDQVPSVLLCVVWWCYGKLVLFRRFLANFAYLPTKILDSHPSTILLQVLRHSFHLTTAPCAELCMCLFRSPSAQSNVLHRYPCISNSL